MFVQIKNGRIVRVSEEGTPGDAEIHLPEDFDYDHIDRYEVKDSGLVRHDLPQAETPESQYVTWAGLEKFLKEAGIWK